MSASSPSHSTNSPVHATSPSPTGVIASWRLLLFAFPATPHAFVVMPLMMVLPSFYAANTGVTLAQIALIATLARLFDAAIDPVVGFLSDLTRSRLGPRKPWLIAAALICPLAILMLFQPPADASVVYYTAFSLLLYVGFTFFEIPRAAWAAELTRDYTERSRVSIGVALANISGSLVFWLMPLALWKLTGTTAITGTTLNAISWLYALLMPLGILLTVLLVPHGVPQLQKAGESAWRTLLQSVRQCRPLWRYVAVISCWGLGQGAFMSLIYIYIADHLKMGEKFPFLMIAYFITQLLAMPVWMRWLRHLERHQAWSLSLAVNILASWAIIWLPVGHESFYPALLIVFVTAFFNAPSNFLPTAILGDVIDYNSLKTGTNKAANFYALNTMAIKITMALGTGAAFGVLAAGGYQVGKPNDSTAYWGLIAAYLGIATVMHLVAAALAWTFPLTRRGHDIVRRRIERRAAASN